MLPEYILLEFDDKFYIARKINTLDSQPPTYRKFLAAVGQPAAEFTANVLAKAERKELRTQKARKTSGVRTDRRVRDHIGGVSPAGLAADTPVEDD